MKSGNVANQPPTISNLDARLFLLDHHFLLPPRNLRENQILSHLFSRLGCIQFDTINVVGRNADLVLQSRVNDYREHLLDQMLYGDRELIDGWDKVASIFPVTDWPFFERHRINMGNNHHLRSAEASDATSEILKKIIRDGAVSSLDFKGSQKTDWAWGPTSVTRAALETLYAEGKLGIHHRVNTRRHFDLIERLVPPEILNEPDPNKFDEEYQEWHVLRRIGSVGIASLNSGEHWLGIYGARKSANRKKVINRLIKKEKITIFRIDGAQSQDFYVRTEDLPRLRNIENKSNSKRAAFIAPLDNLLWNRKLIKDIFKFEYIWEVYKPKEKRAYGYYVLPVLLGEEFVARIDLKFERKQKTLNLVNFWWEENAKKDERSKEAIRDCMNDFILYLGGSDFGISNEANDSFEIKSIFKALI